MHFILINSITEHACTQISMKYVPRNTPFIDFFFFQKNNQIHSGVIVRENIAYP